MISISGVYFMKVCFVILSTFIAMNAEVIAYLFDLNQFIEALLQGFHAFHLD